MMAEVPEAKAICGSTVPGRCTQTGRLFCMNTRRRGNSEASLEFYKDFQGILVTDGLEQYYKVGRELDGVINTNCRVHAHRDYADAIKAMGKKAIRKQSNSQPACQALARIGTIYKLEGTLKEMSGAERLKERKASIKALVEEYFLWLKERLADTSCLPKGKTAEGLRYSVNYEEYLKVFLKEIEKCQWIIRLQSAASALSA